MTEPSLAARIEAVDTHNASVRVFTLAAADGATLPPFTAGAHIDCHLPDGIVRSYSLLNAPPGDGRYVIGVALDRESRGGSRHIHEHWAVGDTVRISAPRNNFALVEEASHSVFIAGGIGITPLLSMMARLDALERPWELHYAARNRGEAAFLERIEAAGLGRAKRHVHFHRDADGSRLDIAAVIAAAPSSAHFYCCGPARMLDDFTAAAAGRPADHLHVEYFTSREAAATEGGFEVVLARRGTSVQVAPGQRILDALIAARVDVSYSCSEGVCGTCETRVIEGIPDHRDMFLSPDEQASNKLIMVCCSGAKTPKLVLDL